MPGSNTNNIQPPNSPLFPPSQLINHNDLNSILASNSSPSTPTNNNNNSNQNIFIPTLPDKPTTSTSSIQAYIIPSEKNLFVQGFDQHEYSSRPPTILRGSLFIRVLKPSKIKSITLTFKGIQRTEWPEGIPPKKNLYHEINDIITHTWPFFSSNNNINLPNNGADFYIEKNGSIQHTGGGNEELSTVRSNTPPPRRVSSNSLSVNGSTTSNNQDNFFTRNLSPSFIRRSKSPSIGSVDAMTELTSVVSPTTDSNMYFAPGDYLYNFEHPLPPSIPETCNVTFGSTTYNLEVLIQRPGTFKSNLSGKLPINIIRTPSELNLEENESIVISRDWEDQIRYDIVIGAKSVVLDSYLPLAFRFVPLWGKVALHRIRIYLTENLEYYCNNKKVHRMEPPKKYLLLEHKAVKGRSLLQKNPQDTSNVGLDQYEEDILPKELEFQLYVPQEITGKSNCSIHPDTSYENIQSHHWIKICLRISKNDPENENKRKHYEISIDSPLHVLSPLAAHGNTLLPAYDDLVENGELPPPPIIDNSPLSPEVTPIEHSSSTSNIRSRFENATRSRSRSPSVANNQQTTREDSPTTPSSAIEFQHISSNLNPGVIERDADMHLEANLYKPKFESTIVAINSPQAIPHPETFTSPLSSPIQRPIHLIRHPSTAPPPFVASPDATKNNGGMSLHPPAYRERDEGSLSLSPLRIDDDSTNYVNPLHDVVSNNNNNNSTPTTLNNIDTNTPVRDLLIQQLNGSTPPQPIETRDSIPNISLPKISINKQHTEPEHHNEPSEEDIADDPASPISPMLAPKTFNNNKRKSKIFESNESNDLILSTSPPKTTNNKPSRRSSTTSSIDSSNSFELPIDQTLPLLNQSTSSIQPQRTSNQTETNQFYMDERNQSITSSMFDLSYKKPTSYQKPKDLFSNDYESRKQFNNRNRNQRLAGHHQPEIDDDDEEDISNMNIPVIPQHHKKSFGVVDTSLTDLINENNETEEGSSLSSNEQQQQQQQNLINSRTNGSTTKMNNHNHSRSIPGFNIDYVIDN
ncbi:uncharacterized protein KGF55_002973 [Candida pseudojiufengensis]|uniref:uncharacterized protein n=1 Tax=Candida pseudojiufengensis TaxID=497109 RepID=UPI00222401C5|nr:uncharacterized protein KGF55_002973 [Candida pseudojiufengensis]KAI5963181.1 hypothetical protein KGF55_002973 [Candida pseudojiufengensis]